MSTKTYLKIKFQFYNLDLVLNIKKSLNKLNLVYFDSKYTVDKNIYQLNIGYFTKKDNLDWTIYILKQILKKWLSKNIEKYKDTDMKLLKPNIKLIYEMTNTKKEIKIM